MPNPSVHRRSVRNRRVHRNGRISRLGREWDRNRAQEAQRRALDGGSPWSDFEDYGGSSQADDGSDSDNGSYASTSHLDRTHAVVRHPVVRPTSRRGVPQATQSRDLPGNQQSQHPPPPVAAAAGRVAPTVPGTVQAVRDRVAATREERSLPVDLRAGPDTSKPTASELRSYLAADFGFRKISLLHQEVANRKAEAWLAKYRPGLDFGERLAVMEEVLPQLLDWQTTDDKTFEQLSQGSYQQNLQNRFATWSAIQRFFAGTHRDARVVKPSSGDDVASRIEAANCYRTGQRMVVVQPSRFWRWAGSALIGFGLPLGGLGYGRGLAASLNVAGLLMVGYSYTQTLRTEQVVPPK